MLTLPMFRSVLRIGIEGLGARSRLYFVDGREDLRESVSTKSEEGIADIMSFDLIY